MSAPQLTMEGIVPAHRNHQLFADHFLNTRLRQSRQWAEAVAASAPALASLTTLLNDRRRVLPALSESQLEVQFIRPILEDILGHTFTVQANLATAAGLKRPDYVLFQDQDAVDAVAGQTLTEELLRSGGLALADAKVWGRSLDAPESSRANVDPFSTANPSSQIAFYIGQSGLPWGILTDGRYWRLYHTRTAHRLDRFYEVDLVHLVDQGRVEEFAYFYAFFRRSAFEASAVLSLDAVLQESADYALGVGDTLKEQVYLAVSHLAQGFLDNPRNELEANPETLAEVYNNSLIVLYRLLFILYAEARELLPLRENERYRRDYSLYAHVRDAAERLDTGRGRLATSGVLWAHLRELFAMVDQGNPPLQIATFNGGLFDPQKHPFLEDFTVGDAHLERALDLISRVGGEFVDYRDLATRHLGTIYEGLLEYHLSPLAEPTTSDDGQRFTIALLNDKGTRQSSGSFYTPDYVVERIVSETLGPVVATSLEGLTDDLARAERLLNLNVLDPAMGSAHFLVEATEFLARQLAGLNVEAGAVGLPPGELVNVSYWKRRVAQSCIYGVDLNGLAVELAKLSLWLTTASKDRPLSFLDHHLRCGNSLVGAELRRLNALQAGPSASRRRRRTAASDDQISLLDTPAFRESMREAVVSITSIEASPGFTVEQVKEQERAYTELRARLIAKFGRGLDIVAAIQYGLAVDANVVSTLLTFVTGAHGLTMRQLERYISAAQQLAAQVEFFHWEIEFPDVFFNMQGESLGDAGGFDAVVGNPPYDVVAAKERGEPVAEVEAFLAYARQDETLLQVLGGKTDLFRLFLARALSLGRPGAAAGFIVPMSLMGDLQAGTLRRFILGNHAIRSIDAFPQKDDYRRRVFPEAKLPTCVIVMTCGVPSDAPFRVTEHPGRWFEEIAGEYEVSRTTILVSDPDSLRIPRLTSSAASGLADKIFRAPGVCTMGDLFTSSQGEINETTMAHLLCEDRATGPKVLRGSNIRRYRFDPNARQGEDKYLDLAAYAAFTVSARSIATGQPRFGYQRNSALDSRRRLLFAELPTPSYCFDSISYIPIDTTAQPFAWLALLNSNLLEWIFRQTSTNNHVSTDQLHRLPALRVRAPGLGRPTPASARAGLVAAALHATAANATVAGARQVGEDVGVILQGTPPRTDVALDVLDALARSMLVVERDRAAALETARLDLEGMLSDDEAAKFSRLWTPLRPPAAAATDAARARHTSRAEEARQRLGALAERILDFDAFGMLDEEQWKWIVRQRLPRLSNLSQLVGLHRAHHPALSGLERRRFLTDGLMNQIVYSAFRLTDDEIRLVQHEIRAG